MTPSRYDRLTAILEGLYTPIRVELKGDDDPDKSGRLRKAFNRAKKFVLEQGGKMTPKMLSEKPIRKAIEVSARGYTAKVDPIIRDLSNSTQRALKQDLHTFAGFKTYHHLQEVAGRSRNADGTLKSWQEFAADTAKIDDKYNKTWLKAEYAFVQSSAQMAAKWERFAEFGDAYDLLYKTAGDERVRADHARLNGMCLPFSDPAWDTCFPPNGWGCRCDVIQVIPGTHPRSESKEVVELMEEMTPGKQEIFRFNPGKEQKLIPPRHPYYGKDGNAEREAIRNNLPTQDIIKKRRAQFEELNRDPNYTDVDFNEENGGIKATHINHSHLKDEAIQWEKTVQEVGFRYGHVVILEEERQDIPNRKNTDGTWDGKEMEIATSTTGTSNNIRDKLKHCASKPNAKVAIINIVAEGEVHISEGFNKYNGLKGTAQWREFDKIIIIYKGKIVAH